MTRPASQRPHPPAPVLALAGGFTAGHVMPGIAVAAALSQLRPDLRLLFLGRAGGFEEELAKKAGLDFTGLPGAPWLGMNTVTRLRSLVLLTPAVLSARRILRARNIVGCASLGSYAAIAPGFATASLRRSLVLLESNAVPGLAHRLLRPVARTSLVGAFWSAHTRGVQRTGVPIRAEIEAAGRTPRSPSNSRLLVLGGSLGDDFLNRAAPDVAAALRRSVPELRILHQCGRRSPPDVVRAAYAAAGVEAEVTPFVDDMARALTWADAALSPAGAISLHELAAAGVPTIAVPLGGAAGPHQEVNAAAFTRATGCPVHHHHGWSATAVARDLETWLIRDPATWHAARQRLQTMEPPGAADRCARALLAACGETPTETR
jgi:UDP-N-acetylglucosamine:LPS N-acetylglucosamine transferase